MGALTRMFDDSPVDPRRVGPAVLPFARVGSGALLLGPGVGKFVTYDRSVRFFAALGLPSPELLVPFVGVVELAAAALLFSDRAPRLGALFAVPVMVVAAATAGPTWQNLGVLATASLVLVLETTAREDAHTVLTR